MPNSTLGLLDAVCIEKYAIEECADVPGIAKRNRPRPRARRKSDTSHGLRACCRHQIDKLMTGDS
jgi:hypothetical protein